MNKEKFVIRWNRVFYIALITFIVLILLTVKTRLPEKGGIQKNASEVGSKYPAQKEGQEFLLQLARKTLEAHFNGTEIVVNEKGLPKELLEKKGCFVTLNKNNQLRGSIGHISAQEELYKCVIDNSLNSAMHDIRFTPLEKEELSNISIEISVLTEPKQLGYNSTEELLERLITMKDGVVLTTLQDQSTYLPQVWEQMPDPKMFLEQLCLKQGADDNCWQEPSTKISTYQTQVFGE